ncbi:GyrI-like domain-containing protein [candidate division WWE3 bacterium]|uniref:GyrI-like domain-containing protein n=1 Tax=candidate division WWE3 bacterium TaxID=2053526 RepID=A0A7X9DLJ5_UNCKA|nr:GyrI-like domain-containing protein [candidate division WWE3 bacterium]
MNKMRPRVTKPLSLKLLGCVYYGNPFHSHEEGSIKNEIGLLWERFYKIYSTHMAELADVIVEKNVSWEVHIQTEELANAKDYTVFAGIQVSRPIEKPIAFFYKELPKTRYAVFEIKGREFMSSLNYIYNNWLPTSKYNESHGYMIWRYDEKAKHLDDPECTLQAYIPIEENKID